MQLRVDGKVVTLGNRLDLGSGNVINRGATAGELDVRLIDGTRVIVTPLFWTSQGYWYLDVKVSNTPARQGVMGPILPGDWLPRAPNGSSFGARPAALPARHVQLNQKFADAWRVNGSTSLFDYAAGTSSADFADRNWPAEIGKSCAVTTIRGHTSVVKEPRPDLAQRACRGIQDRAIMADCLLDVTVMGDLAAAKAHLQADKLKAASK